MSISRTGRENPAVRGRQKRQARGAVEPLERSDVQAANQAFKLQALDLNVSRVSSLDKGLANGEGSARFSLGMNKTLP